MYFYVPRSANPKQVVIMMVNEEGPIKPKNKTKIMEDIVQKRDEAPVCTLSRHPHTRARMLALLRMMRVETCYF